MAPPRRHRYGRLCLVWEPRTDPGYERLLGGWIRHLGVLAPGAGRDRLRKVGRDLLARYGEPHRVYHDRQHLAEVLTAVALLADHAEDLPVVVAAAWWHDAVYIVGPAAEAAQGGGSLPSNEQASADLATGMLTDLGVAPARVNRVAELVLSTITHDPAPDDADAQVLSDADLSILASPPRRYAAYTRDVRIEYAAVPDPLFAAGRSALLTALIAQDRIYRTPSAYEQWERTARANVEAELRDLAS